MSEHRKTPKKKIRATALIEAGLVLIPFLLLTLGGMEFMFYHHVRQSLAAAGMEAVDFVAVDHDELVVSGGGASFNLIDPYRASAIAVAEDYLLEMGFSSSFVAEVQITIDFINRLNPENLDFPNGGFPQNTGRRLVGAMLTVPWSKAMIFGNLSAKVLNLVVDVPTELTVIAFRWKQWKQESGS